MEEVFLPGIVLDEPKPFVNPQRANLACHLLPPDPVVTTEGAPAIPSSVRRIAASFNHPSYMRHAGTQFTLCRRPPDPCFALDRHRLRNEPSQPLDGRRADLLAT